MIPSIKIKPGMVAYTDRPRYLWGLMASQFSCTEEQKEEEEVIMAVMMMDGESYLDSH